MVGDKIKLLCVYFHELCLFRAAVTLSEARLIAPVQASTHHFRSPSQCGDRSQNMGIVRSGKWEPHGSKDNLHFPKWTGHRSAGWIRASAWTKQTPFLSDKNYFLGWTEGRFEDNIFLQGLPNQPCHQIKTQDTLYFYINMPRILSMGQIHTKKKIILFLVYPKFIFNWLSFILTGNPEWTLSTALA